jgi:hypothetical protein
MTGEQKPRPHPVKHHIKAPNKSLDLGQWHKKAIHDIII